MRVMKRLEYRRNRGDGCKRLRSSAIEPAIDPRGPRPSAARPLRANPRRASLTLDETALTLPPNLVLARAFLHAQLNGKHERASANAGTINLCCPRNGERTCRESDAEPASTHTRKAVYVGNHCARNNTTRAGR